MSLQKNIKIKNLLESWPAGYVATSAWLEEMGISRQLTHRYQKSGWIEALGAGAYKRPKETTEWYGGVASLQSHLSLDIHGRGPTACSIRGGSHYIRLGKEKIFLISSLNAKLPKCIADYDDGQPIHDVISS